MPKTYTAPAAFSSEPYVPIPMTAVESRQIAAVGYSAERKTLAISFSRTSGAVYHYPNVEPKTHADFVGAESIGKFFGQHIKPLKFDKFPAPVETAA